jgi:hypothetical protein
MSKIRNKIEDFGIMVAAVLILIAVIAVAFGIRYVWLNYTPCSFHSVKDAPVRCVTPPKDTL